MKEVRIECVINRRNLPDLALRLRKGDAVLVSEERAAGSKDLLEARESGDVQVMAVERYVREEPPLPRPTPPSVRKSRPNMGGMFKPTIPAPPPEPDKK